MKFSSASLADLSDTNNSDNNNLVVLKSGLVLSDLVFKSNRFPLSETL